MLKLQNIVKHYETGGETVAALKGIDLCFRENEFVAILGHSGCGKTTLLNIIGGLDQYTSGDLLISGRSTKEFKDRDWDSYRNHSVGFVFQSYNLIPHQSVLSNVELALTLSGVSKAERRRRAREALEQVGLGDQLHKRPNQMSGGQMQRVAIARALVNDPEILLADEPTGALDSETSVQVMDLLKKVARDRLVIMVTHNPELAELYATRTVRLTDGEILSDSNPYSEEEEAAENARKRTTGREKKPSMSIPTALGLSLNNLMTKKARTILTAFAGAIGIIGIALILSLSTGIQAYIDQVQEDTLSSYPITIEAERMDMSAMMFSLMGDRQEALESRTDENRIYASTVMYDLINSMMNAETKVNDLTSFKAYLEETGNPIADLATIQYSYGVAMDIYTEDTEGNVVKSDVTELMQSAMSAMYGGDYSSFFSSSMGSMYQQMNVWEELLPGEDGALVHDILGEQYDMLYGHWPEKYNEVVLFVTPNNELSDLMLYALGLIGNEEMTEALNATMNGEGLESDTRSWSYEELCAMEFKLILPAQRYQYDSLTKTYNDLSLTQAGMDYLYNSEDVGTPIRVVGIARASENASSAMVQGAIGYTSALTTYAIETTEKTGAVTAQRADETMDIFTALPFATGEEPEPTAEEMEAAIREHLATLLPQDKASAYMDAMSQPAEDYVSATVEQQMAGMTRESIEEMIVAQYAGEMGVDASTVTSYIASMDDETLFAQMREAMAGAVREQYAAAVAAQMSAMTVDQLAGALDAALSGSPYVQPLTAEQYVYLYENYMPATLSEATYEENLKKLGYVDLQKPSIINIYATTFADKDAIAEHITAYNERVGEDKEITYTDYVAILMSSITTIINAISYVLIAFVAISLVVSSIMIGIITYISVLERTKEIGILRAIGASKGDISRVFNAETVIEGFISGAMGIGVTLLFLIPINALIHYLTDIPSLSAVLPWKAAVILVCISMVLTFIAGLVPARIAAKKDPVEALRTE